MNGLTKAAQDVLAERQRQQEREGYTIQHDDEHSYNSLALAGVSYATIAARPDPDFLPYGGGKTPASWPWEPAAWKPKGPRRDLVRATALLLAAIEKIDREDSTRGVLGAQGAKP